MISERKRIWGWFFFDWASQPYHTLLVTFVFGPFFALVAAEHFAASGLEETAAKARAQTMWSWTLALAGLIIAFGAPFLGALADTTGRRRPWIAAFSMMCVAGAAGLWWTDPNGANLGVALGFFALGFIGVEYALIFVNSQLPSLGSEDKTGAISGMGFAFGYLGGLFSLAIMLVFFMTLEGGRTVAGFRPALGLDPALSEDQLSVGPFVALWFALFMVPYFLWVCDISPPATRLRATRALAHLTSMLKALPQRPSLFAFLGSSMLYRDALNGLYAFGGTYAVLVLDWSTTQVGIFGIISVVAAAGFSWIGGRIDQALGPKPVILGAIWGLITVCVLIVGMDRTQILGVPLAAGSSVPDRIFVACGILIGGLGGTLQATSRTLMVRHTDPAAATAGFALYGLSGRATAFLAPALIGLVTAWSGDARFGVAPLIVLFAGGLVLLHVVQAEGDRKTWQVGQAGNAPQR
ncbi:MAG: MFS transporter [Pseudomonadota bacterium]